MRRRLRLPTFLGTCAALSALAFLALCVLWWRSDTHEDGLQLGTVGGAMWGVNSRRDRIEVLRVGDWPVREGPGVQTSSDDRPAPMTLVYLSPPTSDWFGFGMSVTRGSGAIPLNPDGTPWQHRRSDGLSGVRHWKFCPALRIAMSAVSYIANELARLSTDRKSVV